MRKLSALILGLLGLFGPTVAHAEQFEIDSHVTRATIYSDVASFERAGSFSVPAGRHELILRDIPLTAILESLRVNVDGADLLYLKTREDFIPPGTPERTPEYKAAKQAVREAEDKIAALRDRARALRLAASAADAEVTFLTHLGRNNDLAATDPEALRALTRMIGEETQRARQGELDNEIQARVVEQRLEDLQDDLEIARAALEAVPVEDPDRHYVVLGVEVAAEGQVDLALTYVTIAVTHWRPVYDFLLTRGDRPTVTIERNVVVYQQTGENWTDVRLRLSTLNPSGNLEPFVVHPYRHIIVDPLPPRSMNDDGNDDGAGLLEKPIVEAPIIVEDSLMGIGYEVQTEGLAVAYEYADPVSLTSGADAMRLRLDTLELDAEIFAKATETRPETAFLMAKVTNNTGEELLAADEVVVFVDGALVGGLEFPGLVNGDDTELGFGPIDGLRVELRTLDRSEGDRGIISRTNSRVEAREITMRNLTGETWPVQFVGSVPYSEQDDLQIEWDTTPSPSEVNVDGSRGLLRWDFDLPAGDTWTLNVDTQITWPDGKELR